MTNNRCQHPQQPLPANQQQHSGFIAGVVGVPVDPPGTEDWDTCPLCGGRWINCGCDPDAADAAYQTGDAA